MKVTVAYSPAPHQVDLTELDLPAGSSVAAALDASGLRERHAEVAVGSLRVGIWGRACDLQTPLRDGDRVEVYRPLKIDPKDARRRRGQLQKRRQPGRR